MRTGSTPACGKAALPAGSFATHPRLIGVLHAQIPQRIRQVRLQITTFAADGATGKVRARLAAGASPAALTRERGVGRARACPPGPPRTGQGEAAPSAKRGRWCRTKREKYALRERPSRLPGAGERPDLLGRPEGRVHHALAERDRPRGSVADPVGAAMGHRRGHACEKARRDPGAVEAGDPAVPLIAPPPRFPTPPMARRAWPQAASRSGRR